MLESKLPKVGTTIFTIMSAMAQEHGAINLGQGFPDFSMSPDLVGLVNKAMVEGYNQYVPMQGYLPLRESIAEKIEHQYQLQVHLDTELTITPGGTYALYTAMTTILRPGDEVIVPEPAYDSYIPGIELNGAIPVRVDMSFPNYSIDWEKIRDRVTPRTRMIILNSPHNPTGSVLGEQDIRALRALVAGTEIYIVSDEVYEHLIFDNLVHHSMLRYPDLYGRSFVCFSFGKTYHCTGWKLGYCVAPPELTTEFRKVHQFNSFCCNTPTQVALAEYLRNKEAYMELGAFLQERRDYFHDLMQATRFDALPSYGTYFQCYRYERISDEPDREFCARLTRQYGVAAIPVSAFYQDYKDDRVVRFCFAKKPETLAAAVERLLHIS